MPEERDQTQPEQEEVAGGASTEKDSQRRGRPGRRSAEDRTQAILELMEGKTTADQLATRFGVRPETIEKWRQDAIAGMTEALKQGSAKSPRERELEKKLGGLEKAFTDLAIRHELVQRALKDRPSRRDRS